MKNDNGGQRPERPDEAAATLRIALFCGAGAYLLWGLMPAYLKTLTHVAPLEIVAHRVAWSVPFGALILSVRKQWRETLAAFLDARIVRTLTITSLLIAANWLIYVWAVANDKVLQASLGYYINPLVFIGAGVVLLGEKLTRLQKVAMALAAAGVIVLTVGARTFPFVSIALALLFTGYGIIRKRAPVGAMPGLFLETALLTPAAAGYIAVLAMRGESGFLHEGAATDALLVMGGPVTVVPLFLFALAARRMRLVTLGFLQYIAPTGQFLLGLYYGEAFTLAHALCFGLIWAGLALVSYDALASQRQTAARAKT